MPDYESFNDKQIKHLEFIQAVITRLGNNGLLVKGWALTITVALLGFAVNSTDWRLALIAIVPSLAFWGLDAYFLQAERLYRALYQKVARETPDIEPFDMAATSPHFWNRLSPTVAAGLKWHIRFARLASVSARAPKRQPGTTGGRLRRVRGCAAFRLSAHATQVEVYEDEAITTNDVGLTGQPGVGVASRAGRLASTGARASCPGRDRRARSPGRGPVGSLTVSDTP